MTDHRPDTPGSELPANAEQTEPSDLAPEPSTDVPAQDEQPAEPEQPASADEPAPAADQEGEEPE
ncbi:MAG TPA: hypothetical protein VGR12_03050, partial [Solirubrobacteraceae bacterium]|nr:hypothetical protein [Solirubrobacteraceae bacterium]